MPGSGTPDTVVNIADQLPAPVRLPRGSGKAATCSLQQRLEQNDKFRHAETDRGPTPGASSDVVLCPDVVPFDDHRFGCCDLPQRGVIHHGTGKASAVIRVILGSGPWGPFRIGARTARTY
jgi:hypothetical protein